MAYGLIDLTHPKGRDDVLTGEFVRSLSAKAQKGILFRYGIVNPQEWHYQRLLGNLITNDGATLTIKTCNDLDFVKDGEFGYMLLQDGKTYKINSVTDDIREAPKQVLRVFKSTPFTDHIIRLVEVDNVWR